MVTNAVMPDQLGGLQRYVRELAGAIVARGVPVTVLAKRVTPEAPRYERAQDGVEIRRFDVPDRGHPLYAAAYPAASLVAVTRAIAATERIVHVHYPLQGVPAALLPGPYLHTFHAPIHRELLPEHQDRYALPGALRGTLVAVARAGERLVAERARASIVLTRYMRGQLGELSPAAAQRAELIPAGIDTDHFSPGPGIEHAAARGADPLIFTARRLVPRTGVTELVRAMPAILAQLPGARLAIAGDGPLRAGIRALIDDLALANQVFLLGRVSETELLGWYRAAELFVLPTQELEGFGISTVEALACGTPVVGTPVGGTPEILAEIDPRLLAAGPSSGDLAAAVLEVAVPEGVLDALAPRVRARVRPALSWPTIADRHLEVYERMAHG